MADLSKVKVLGTEYNLKDAKGRDDLAALMERLGTAAYKDVKTTLEEMAAGDIIDGVAMKAYVDAQVGAIHKFDVVVADELPTASADTMYKLYLIPKSGSQTGNVKEEWITVRSGAASSYTYAWEKIGDTEIDLSGYVQKTQKVAGIDLQDDITVAELQGALNLGALAYLNSGSVEIATADSITMDSYTPSGSITINDLTQTSTNAVIATKADYTPAGSITGTAIKDGSINVTVKDAATATNAVIAASSTFTPAGTVAAVDGGDFQALKSATFQADESGVAIEGTVSAPAVNLTSSTANVAIGVKGGSVAALDTTKFSGGSFTGASQASFTQGAKASFTQGAKASFAKGTAVSAAIEGVVASIGSGADAETLILTAARTDNVMDFDATFTPNGNDTFTPNGDDTFTANAVGTFTPAALAEGFFTPNTLQQADMGTVNNVTAAALANAPVFTGAKYKVATTADTALKEVAFEATNNVSVPTQITYLKQEIDTKTFTPVAATLGFEGTETKNLIPTVITYDKATANGGSFSGSAAVLTGTVNKTDKTVSVTFA